MHHSLTAWSNADPLNMDAQEILNKLNVLAASVWQLLIRRTIANGSAPTLECFVLDIDLGENVQVRWEARQLLVTQHVSSGDLDFWQIVEYIKLGQVKARVSID